MNRAAAMQMEGIISKAIRRSEAEQIETIKRVAEAMIIAVTSTPNTASNNPELLDPVEATDIIVRHIQGGTIDPVLWRKALQTAIAALKDWNER